MNEHAENMDAETPNQLDTSREGILAGVDTLVETANKGNRLVRFLSSESYRQRIDMAKTVPALTTVFKKQYPAVEFSIDIPETAYVLAVEQIKRALQELIENSIEHNDASNPIVEVLIEKDHDTSQIHIRDNAPQIPEMEQLVLDGDKNTDQLYHASGLGLWLVYWIVRRSGGTIIVETNESRGNLVTIRLNQPSEEMSGNAAPSLRTHPDQEQSHSGTSNGRVAEQYRNGVDFTTSARTMKEGVTIHNMDVAIISDSHIPSRATRIPSTFSERIRTADHVIHAGDFDSKGALADMQDMAPALTAVHGNMDPSVGLPAVATVELAGVEFVVTHGTGSPRDWESRVARTAREHANTDTVVGIAGHTHEVTEATFEGVQLLNPGSVTGASPASRTTMMTASVERGTLDVTVHEQ